MGYTHYFQFKQNIGEFSKEVLADIQKVFDRYSDIVDVYEFDKNTIHFNGIEDEGYEDFFLQNSTTNFNFCKTAERKYDLPECEILLILKHHYGDNFELSSDGFRCDYDDICDINKDIDKTTYWTKAFDNIKQNFGYSFIG